MNLFDVVMKLNGPVTATGEHNADMQRIGNLVRLTGLIDDLLVMIHDAASDEDRPEASRRAIGQLARKYLRSLKQRDAEGG